MDTAGAVQYFGFTEHGGGWYIMKYDQSANTFRYARGTSSYSSNWTGRVGISYDYFYNVF